MVEASWQEEAGTAVTHTGQAGYTAHKCRTHQRLRMEEMGPKDTHEFHCTQLLIISHKVGGLSRELRISKPALIHGGWGWGGTACGHIATVSSLGCCFY